MPKGLTPEQRARFEPFLGFRIQGVCGTEDLDRLQRFGVNTVRGYTIPSGPAMRAELDKVHRRGMKMIISEWMPHHGENKGDQGGTWNFDYDERGDAMVEKFVEKIEAVGDHPAILMWGLGNEVPCEPAYLRVVNRMSEAIHKRFPNHITSLTMINAKPEAIAAVKRYAPDLDVLGIQSYSPGAVRNAIKNTEQHWGRPFYFSEFNGKGPWNFAKTDWGEALDEPVPQKVRDLKSCYQAIDASPLALGSTVFVWGHFRVGRPTYFSLLLAKHPDGVPEGQGVESLLVTPQAEVLAEHFTGRRIRGNRAPVLTRVEFPRGERSASVRPAEGVRVRLAASDRDGDRVALVAWVLDSKPRKPVAVAGPYESGSSGLVRFDAPDEPGEYLVMAYALDGNGGASASTLPLQVLGTE
ncbi:MAG: glycoside hydrolase family 2 TIM barrel-domain containing protein [Planctomycetota bacterium]